MTTKQQFKLVSGFVRLTLNNNKPYRFKHSEFASKDLNLVSPDSMIKLRNLAKKSVLEHKKYYSHYLMKAETAENLRNHVISNFLKLNGVI